MSVAKEFTTDRNTDVKTAGNRVIEGCNSLLVAYTRDSFKVRAGLPTENKNAVSLAGVEILESPLSSTHIDVYIIPKISNDFNNKL